MTESQEDRDTKKNRFSFYNAEEVNQTSNDKCNGYKASTDKSPPILTTTSNRRDQFHYPNAHDETQKTRVTTSRENLMGKHPIAHTPQVVSSVAKTVESLTLKECERTTVISSKPPNSIPMIHLRDYPYPLSSDSSEILRSLQETEEFLMLPKQRLIERGAARTQSKSNGNPFEDAIQDALIILRTKQLSNDALLRTRTLDVSDPVINGNLEKKIEHDVNSKIMTQVEGPCTAPTLDTNTTTTLSPLPHRIHRTNVNRLLQARSRETSPDIMRSHSSAYSVEPSVVSSATQGEIQKGVERVLMAILERAKCEENDNLASALDDLIPFMTDSIQSLETQREAPPSRRISQEQTDVDVTPKPSQISPTPSHVDEILVKDDKIQIGNTQFLTIPSSTAVEGDEQMSPQSTFSQSTFSKITQENYCASPLTPYYQDSDEALDIVLGPMAVLGPLSKRAGGTTGVVLEQSTTRHAEDDILSETASSILDSISSAVKDAETFVAYMTSGVSMDESKRSAATSKDKYSTQAEDDDSDADDSDNDIEANGLMRSLCAHLLPFGVDKATHLSEIPPWDESNPNEPGYRIVRLSKLRLNQVENEFAKMVNGFQRKSERLFEDKRQHYNESADWHGVSDTTFERNLDQAEELLDQEEKRQEAVEKAVIRLPSFTRSESSTPESYSTEESDVEIDSERENGGMNVHPDFPCAQTAGKGEIGDLEYFNLPIIYKSHLTGFEPTKDLRLDPGNVVAGQYLVESELGTAAFSTAYRCIDLSSDTTGIGECHEEVCLKVIKNTKDFFDQSLDEIKILELLRQTGKCHEKFIVEMKTFFYHREHLVIVTELLRQNLFEFGKSIIESDSEPYFTLKRLCFMTRQCLLALEFVHGLGLVHSDIKPENILLSSYSRAIIKIIDFGSSCYLTDRQSSYIQSRSYRAPEVVLGLPYNGKIDMWSLGCVVCEMFTGEVTFQNDTIVSMLSRIEAICGAFPRHMIAQGRQSAQFFTKSGLLYELVDSNESRINPIHADSDSEIFDIFQPKRTTIAARLGFNPEGVDQGVEPEQAFFVDFCRSMLMIDPDCRMSAAEALEHPWIVSGKCLTENDIQYPSIPPN